jgi:hypothetical protein
MKKRLMIAALCGVFMTLSVSPEAYAQGMNLTGTWQVKSDKDPGVTILKLNQSGESVSGTWQPAHGDPSEIENGKIVGEILTFSLTRNAHPINAPSKRNSPASVPIHTYPSVVWVIAVGAPAKTPSRTRQAVCAY